MQNKKLVWDQVSQGMAEGGYTRSAQQCRVKIYNLKQKYRKIRGGNKISGNLPRLNSRRRLAYDGSKNDGRQAAIGLLDLNRIIMISTKLIGV